MQPTILALGEELSAGSGMGGVKPWIDVECYSGSAPSFRIATKRS